MSDVVNKRTVKHSGQTYWRYQGCRKPKKTSVGLSAYCSNEWDFHAGTSPTIMQAIGRVSQLHFTTITSETWMNTYHRQVQETWQWIVCHRDEAKQRQLLYRCKGCWYPLLDSQSIPDSQNSLPCQVEGRTQEYVKDRSFRSIHRRCCGMVLQTQSQIKNVSSSPSQEQRAMFIYEAT